MSNQKIDKISNLNFEELSVLCETLFSKINFSRIKKVDSRIIEAYQETGLEERRITFLLNLTELSGKNQELLEKIKTIEGNVDTLYIVTTSVKKISNYFKQWISKEIPNQQIKFWNNSDIVSQTDKNYSKFWSNSDTYIVPYEDFFLNKVKEDIEIRSLLKLDKKFDSLLDIFIEPRLTTFTKDKEAERLTRKNIDKDKIVKSNSYVLSGEAGTGKTTLLKQIGKDLISNNTLKGDKNVPILIKINDLTLAKFDLTNTISNILLKVYNTFEFEYLYAHYSLILLFDSIDELEKDIQKSILKQLDDLSKNLGIRYIISTRNYDYLLKDCTLNTHERIEISNFNQKQIKTFLDNFFRFDTLKADKLWQSLQENNILEKIPVTPLTLSILSILYEERQYEIPATITDVYDNFNLFLLGRTTVKSNLEFIDLGIKERILSLYALEVIQEENRERKTKDEFTNFIYDFFETRNRISRDLLPELVNSLTQDTGILFIDEANRVSFKHDYFMEYYASLEIFKHNRGLESKLIEYFTDFNWQNTSIFYAGRTKDMPEFLTKLLVKVKDYQQFNDCLIGVSGLGYLIQALWLTNVQVRKEAVINALELVVKIDVKFKEMASNKFPYFNNLGVLDIALLNLFWFYQHYNSVTLRDSLALSFDELYEQHNLVSKSAFTSDRITLEFKMFCIACTLAIGINNSTSKLEQLFDLPNILTSPLFIPLFDVAIDILNPISKQLKDDNKIKNRVKKYGQGIKFYIENPAEKLRFTTWDNIHVMKDVEIYTEGKTDAEIIKHVHSVLTNNQPEYWNIQSCGNLENEGGATQLNKFLSSIAPKLDNNADRNKIIIGLFDNDSKGIGEFTKLGKSNIFDYYDGSKRVLKHKTANIFAIKLPIPPNKEYYIQEKQVFNFFEIEHYLPLEFLKSNDMIKETGIKDIFEIKNSKNNFSKLISKNNDLEVFQDFKYLFNEIDVISKNKTKYVE